MKTLCFTGHRPNKFSFKYDESHPDCIKIKNLFKEKTEKAILRGCELFVVGMAIGVDIWSAEILLELKKTYPHIKLEAAIPCIN